MVSPRRPTTSKRRGRRPRRVSGQDIVGAAMVQAFDRIGGSSRPSLDCGRGRSPSQTGRWPASCEMAFRMEGPSLRLAAEQLQPFVGRTVARVTGNSKIGIERLHGKHISRIFSWGKHLVFQFDTFALRVHFMLWGTFAATVEGASVTGDYRRSGPPRLVLEFSNGAATLWSASLRFLESSDAR